MSSAPIVFPDQKILSLAPKSRAATLAELNRHKDALERTLNALQDGRSVTDYVNLNCRLSARSTAIVLIPTKIQFGSSDTPNTRIEAVKLAFISFEKFIKAADKFSQAVELQNKGLISGIKCIFYALGTAIISSVNFVFDSTPALVAGGILLFFGLNEYRKSELIKAEFQKVKKEHGDVHSYNINFPNY